VAGEIGHLAMDPHGELCICGLRGCLATMVGAPALVKRAEALLAEHPRSVLAGTRPTITSIEDGALGGDELALHVGELVVALADPHGRARPAGHRDRRGDAGAQGGARRLAALPRR